MNLPVHPLAGQRVGYARISSASQNLDGQTDALTAAGCQKIFADTASGKLTERPELTFCLGYLRAGDTLVVWRLDRLGRSLRHLVETVNALADRRVAFASLHEGIDTTTSTGRLVFHIFAALAEFERELIAERAAVGRTAARARGRLGGRPAKLSPEQARLARARYKAQDVTVAEIARALGVGRGTIYRALPAGRRQAGSAAVTEGDNSQGVMAVRGAQIDYELVRESVRGSSAVSRSA